MTKYIDKKWIVGLILGMVFSACGVKKAPSPLYAYPINFEADSASPTPSPGSSP
ncbi:MAG: hypothetical protein H7333_11250 [Bdellovibrionales bacterium]|nr:hypothetical protein [Oligoflexia bacterium]